jgi:TonB family protein
MVFWVWVTGAGANILLLLVGLVRLRLLRAGAEQLFSGPWRKLADEVSRTTGCRRRVELWQSAHPAFLMTWGWIRPRILLPTGAGTWSEERIRVVLGHEVAHIARGDWALQLLSECLRSLHWFNPLTWLVSAWLQRESERACDDVVLSLGTEGTTFATHLVALARAARQRRHGWFPAAAMAQPSNLERRVSAMLNVECKRNQVSRRSRTATALAFALVAVLVAGLTGVAQSASVAGEILDQTGRPIPEASVTLIDRDSQDRQTTEADASGRFEIVDVTPSDYSLIIGRPGFAQFFQRLEINSGEQLEESFSLELGSVEETITVTDAVPSQTPVVRTASPNRRRRQRGNRPQGGQIQPPIKVRDVAAVYPESLRDSGFDGTVVLDAVIKTNGFVEILQILAPVDPVSMVAVDPDVPRAAVEAVEQWRYEPTRLHDVPVDTPVSISVRFRPSE